MELFQCHSVDVVLLERRNHSALSSFCSHLAHGPLRVGHGVIPCRHRALRGGAVTRWALSHPSEE